MIGIAIIWKQIILWCGFHWWQHISSKHMIQQQGGKISRDRSVIRLFAHVCKKTSSPEEAKYDSTWMNTFNIKNKSLGGYGFPKRSQQLCVWFNQHSRYSKFFLHIKWDKTSFYCVHRSDGPCVSSWRYGWMCLQSTIWIHLKRKRPDNPNLLWDQIVLT